MNKSKSSISLLLLTFGILLTTLQTMTHAAEKNQLKAFPLAKENMQRFVINLPHKERGEEDVFKVELLPGKMMLTDGVNRVRLGTRIEPQPLKGWGYTYYEVTGKAIGMSTMMGVPEGTQMMKTFVAGEALMIRYNSRLPIVVYVPNGQLLKYRIWKADAKHSSASQG